MDLSHLLTEQHRPELDDLDRRSTRQLVELMSDDQRQALDVVAAAATEITAAIDAIVERLEAGGRLIYVGAGTAGRLGLLDAAECPPTFNTDRVIGVMAGGPEAFLVSREAVEDSSETGAVDMDSVDAGELDAVVGLAASGRTPYTIGAVQRARELGAVTIGISCNPDSELSQHVDHALELVVGPEVIAGSTRLKAGTAQKTVLNIISTVSMVRIGKTYGNLMVDLKATNLKLQHRARQIVVQATEARPKDAEQALAEAEGDVRVAIIMLLEGAGPGEARDRLGSHNGNLRNALERA